MNEYTKLLNEYITQLKKIDNKQLEYIEKIITKLNTNSKIIFIGNGGSAAIASHMAVDYSKNGNIRSISFNDASLITCLANDYSFENLFSKAIEMYANRDDILIAISSSGKSKDILNAVDAAHELGIGCITFSGFESDNPLRKKGEINVYVDSKSYRVVELAHEYVLHSILENIINKNTNK